MSAQSELAWREGEAMPPAMVARFWAKVEKSDDGCWLWTGRRFGGTDYGSFSVCVITWRGRAWRPEAAHRLAYELAHGPISPGFHVLHSCDVRTCVRPDHLRVGTDGDNKADAVLRGRLRHGHRHHWAKLSERDVLRMRRLYATGTVTQLALANRFGVDYQAVNAILHGRVWRRVGGPVIPPGVRLQTKLTHPQVAEIRRLRRDGRSLSWIAQRFGITKTHVSRIVNYDPSVWRTVS